MPIENTLTDKPLRILWDGEKLAAVVDIGIDELDSVIARLSELAHTLRQQQGAQIFEPPKPKLILPGT